MYICTPLRAISSAGSEHLVYTEGVGGSNPSLPTKKTPLEIMEFFMHTIYQYWFLLYLLKLLFHHN